jgi:hypothetical protein
MNWTFHTRDLVPGTFIVNDLWIFFTISVRHGAEFTHIRWMMFDPSTKKWTLMNELPYRTWSFISSSKSYCIVPSSREEAR